MCPSLSSQSQPGRIIPSPNRSGQSVFPPSSLRHWRGCVTDIFGIRHLLTDHCTLASMPIPRADPLTQRFTAVRATSRNPWRPGCQPWECSLTSKVPSIALPSAASKQPLRSEACLRYLEDGSAPCLCNVR